MTASWIADLTTKHGVKLHVRPSRPDDRDALIALFGRVSPQDRRFRFMGTVQQVGEEQVAPMLDEGGAVKTFLAFNDAGDLIACASLFDEPDGEHAEVTLSVDAGWKGKGVSWTLLDHLLSYARAHGIRRVNSIASGEDHAAIDLEREMGFVARLLSADPIELSLSKVID
jgi:acetyltransferase